MDALAMPEEEQHLRADVKLKNGGQSMVMVAH